MDAATAAEPIEPVYQGHFGEFTITASDRKGVVIYRAGLMVAALCFAIGVSLLLWRGADPTVQRLLTPDRKSVV